MEDLLRVGVITSTHGIKGEVKVFPTTDDVNRFKILKEVIINKDNKRNILKITNVKFFKNLAILKFEGYDTIEDIEKFKGQDIFVTRDNAVELEEGEFFIADLIGLSVITNEGLNLGTLIDVLQSSANDVYVIEGIDKKEILIPAIKDCIISIDLHENLMTVKLLEGLLDL